MAILAMESFETYSTVGSSTEQADYIRSRGAVTPVGGSSRVVTDAGMPNGKKLQYYNMANSTNIVATVAGAYQDTFYWGSIMFSNLNSSTSTNGISLRMQDANGVPLTVKFQNKNAVVVSYNPAGSGNDISETVNSVIPINGYYYCIVGWTPSHLRVWLDNKLVFEFAWTGVAGKVLGYSGYGSEGYSAFWVATTNLGMAQFSVGTLGTPSLDEGTRTGGSSTQDALSSFDGDTSYLTYGEASGDETTLPVVFADVGGTVHAVKVATEASGIGGVLAEGKINLTTPDGTSSVGAIVPSVTYLTSSIYLDTDPATSAAFDATDFASGISIGVQEGV